MWTRNVWCSVLYSFSPFAYFKQACGEGEKPLIARYLGIDWWKSEWINYFLYVWSASRRPLQISAACYVQKHTLSIVAFLNFIIISITNKRENMYKYIHSSIYKNIIGKTVCQLYKIILHLTFNKNTDDDDPIILPPTALHPTMFLFAFLYVCISYSKSRNNTSYIKFMHCYRWRFTTNFSHPISSQHICFYDYFVYSDTAIFIAILCTPCSDSAPSNKWSPK